MNHRTAIATAAPGHIYVICSCGWTDPIEHNNLATAFHSRTTHLRRTNTTTYPQDVTP